ncbi:MAG: hypothetical protein PHH98_02895 [Candidatus Gracilibacteria bacterium]|nr:hypothetical protein [Candidatus Gracilibacteria bacterium]
MGFKEVLKKEFFESDNKVILRYKSAKAILVLMILLFFCSFYFIGAGFYRDFFSKYISIIYVLFVFTIFIYSYFFFRKTFKQNPTGYSLILGLFGIVIVFLVLVLPIIFEGGIMGLLNK